MSIHCHQEKYKTKAGRKQHDPAFWGIVEKWDEGSRRTAEQVVELGYGRCGRIFRGGKTKELYSCCGEDGAVEKGSDSTPWTGGWAVCMSPQTAVGGVNAVTVDFWSQLESSRGNSSQIFPRIGPVSRVGKTTFGLQVGYRPAVVGLRTRVY
jgi:hypothetical protein